MTYTGKTNWQLDETIKPTDVNKWEQGIIDINTDLTTHKSSSDHDNHYTPIIDKMKYVPNSFNRGSVANDGSCALLNTTNSNAPTAGRDLKVTFSRGDATDDYGVNSVSVIGNPTFTNGKFNSNGTTGLTYPNFTTLGSGTWAIEGKIKATSMATQIVLGCSKTQFGFNLGITTAGKAILYLSSNGSSNDIANGVLGNSTLLATTDYHWVIAFDGSAYRVYINDVLEITINSNLKVISNIIALVFGINYDYTSLPLIGTMDDLRVTIGSSTIVDRTTMTSLSFNTTTPAELTDYAYNRATLNSIASQDLSSMPINSKINAFVGTDGSVDLFTQAQYGKDFYCDFSQGSAVDNYGLHPITTIGNPTYTNGKFYSNGTTGLSIPAITTLGTGAWCIQGKFCSTNTTTFQQLLHIATSVAGVGFGKLASNKLSFGASSNNSSNDIANATGIKSDWSTTQEYYIRLRFTGTQYLVDWSTDGNTWTNDITVNSSLIVYQSLGALYFGTSNIQQNPLIGTMDELQVTIGDSVCRRRNKYTIAPTDLYPMAGDIIYNTSNFPVMQKYDTNLVAQPYNKVYAGSCNLDYANNVIAINQTRYNQNGYDVNWKTQGYRFPDYLKGINKTVNTTYIAEADGWLILAGLCNNGTLNTYINNIKIGEMGGGSSGTPSYARVPIPICKGDTYLCTTWGTFMDTPTLTFYPAKGAK